MSATIAVQQWIYRHSVIAFVLASLAATAVMFAAYPPIDPGSGWNDHYFYWGQADAWFNLNQPLQLQPDVQSLLDKYRVEYYYEAANGASQQPPYIYRVGVPLLAGMLGLAMPLQFAFLLIAISSFVALGTASAVTVQHLTRSFPLGLLAAVVSITIPGLATYTRFFAMVDTAAIAGGAVVLSLVVLRRYKTALVIAAIVLPLLKETSAGVALFVAVAMWLEGDKGFTKWLLGFLPLLTLGALRLLLVVPAPPGISELYVGGSPFESGHSFIEAFGMTFPLLIGLGSSRMRAYVFALLPILGVLIVVNSSVVAAGERIWLTLWPFIVGIGISGIHAIATSRLSAWTMYGSLISGLVLANAIQLGYAPRAWLTAWFVVSLSVIVASLGAQLRKPQGSLPSASRYSTTRHPDKEST